MRKELKKLDHQRISVIAKVDRYGKKSAFRGEPLTTILLKDVREETTGKLLTDHLWMTAGKWSKQLTLGCEFRFDARVSMYEKGYNGHREDVFDRPSELDYRLERPTKVVPLSLGKNLT